MDSMGAIATKIAMFIQKNPGITVSYASIDNYDALAVEMMSGTAPDIIFNSSYHGTKDYKGYGERGLLTNFKTLMANDPDFDASLYISSVLKSTEDANGAMYAFPFLFNYSLVNVNTSAPASIVSDFTSRNGISLSDMLQAYAGLSGEGGLKILNEFNSGKGHYFNLDSYFINAYTDYINYADKTCDFTNPAFIQMMKYMKMFQIPAPNTVFDTSYYGASDDIAVSKQYLYFCWPGKLFVPRYFLPYDDNHFEHHIPLTDQNGNVWVDDFAFSIYNGSHNQDLAWELIKYLTSDTVQSTLPQFNGNPVTVKAFSSVIKGMIADYVNGMRFNGYNLTADDANTAEQNALAAYIAINDMPMVDFNGQSRNLDSVVQPDFDNFLSDATTAEQAAANMQNKVELYLGE